jgi:hypothetical protein
LLRRPRLRRMAGRGDMDRAPRRQVHQKERVDLAELCAKPLICFASLPVGQWACASARPIWPDLTAPRNPER